MKRWQYRKLSKIPFLVEYKCKTCGLVFQRVRDGKCLRGHTTDYCSCCALKRKRKDSLESYHKRKGEGKLRVKP